MKPFAFEAPDSLDQAIQLLSRHGGAALPLAGGTDLLIRMKAGVLRPRVLVDICGIEELKGIELTPAGLRLGSLATHTQIANSPLVKEHAPAVAQASACVGAAQTRNLGSLGGNLAAGVPSMDGAPALLALDARAVICGPQGSRSVDLEQVFSKPHHNRLAPGELLKEVIVPQDSLGKPAGFVKFGRRKAMSLAIVNAAAAFNLDENGNITDPRLALGAVAPTPMRALAAEEFLAGKPPTQEAFAQAAKLAAAEARPIDDFRASARYRRQLVEVLTRRALTQTAARADQAAKGIKA